MNKVKTNQTQKGKKKNTQKISIAAIVGILILVYFIYAIIQLVKQPTDTFVIENGKLSQEESAIRICDTSRNCCTRK